MNKVDIILPNYNSADFLNECFEYICNQSYMDFHVIVVDNGSTDESHEIISSWVERDSRIELIVNEENIGSTGSIIKGFNVGEAEYAMFLPADDRIEPDFLKLTVEALDQNKEAAFAYTASAMAILGDENNVASEESRFVPHYCSGVYSEAASMMLNYYTGIPLIRKSIYNEIGGFMPDLLQAVDYEYYIRAAGLYQTVFINSNQQKSLKHEKQLSKLFYKNGQAFWDFNKVYNQFFENELMPIPLRLFSKTVEYSRFTGKTISEMAQWFINSPEPAYRNIMLEHQDVYLFHCVEAILSQYHLRGLQANLSSGKYGTVQDAAGIATYLVSRQHKKTIELLEYHKLCITG
ncbi:MAG: glycosyltransferase family 2 protein [Gammaproteobacteria bacterium]|nr:glycosyltransferase family 2 protein [Gammaproteobacteria bacterium]